MNWKSTVLLSGAGVVATWLAASPTVRAPVSTPMTPVQEAAHSAEAATDIVQQADRLRAKLQTAAVYQEPARNPFRFGERIRLVPTAGSGGAEVSPAPVSAVPEQPAFVLTLSGIAEDIVDGQVLRTAIISTPHDVVLVKEGDTVDDQFRVVSIATDSVELTSTTDSSRIHLTLKP